MYRPATALVAALISGGCYFRTPFHGLSPSPGASVEVTLTPMGSDSLASLLGAGTRVIDGRVVPSGPDTLALAVSRALLFDGTIQLWRGEHVALPHRAIATVEGRRFSPMATALIVGGTVAGLVALAKAVKKTPVQCPPTAFCAIP
ncbi:MAG TPA: hypothetical protein VNA31_07290 [bacterium]|nr:hypothetical protein [bacterium]